MAQAAGERYGVRDIGLPAGNPAADVSQVTVTASVGGTRLPCVIEVTRPNG